MTLLSLTIQGNHLTSLIVMFLDINIGAHVLNEVTSLWLILRMRQCILFLSHIGRAPDMLLTTLSLFFSCPLL